METTNKMNVERVIQLIKTLSKEEQESAIHMLELCGRGEENES